MEFYYRNDNLTGKMEKSDKNQIARKLLFVLVSKEYRNLDEKESTCSLLFLFRMID